MDPERYWVYVLRNPAGKFYTGVSEDVTLRLEQHNAGASKWTKKFRPWVLVWQQGPMTLGEARKLENWLKRQNGGRSFYEFTRLRRSDSADS
jgi:putative endonuclease